MRTLGFRAALVALVAVALVSLGHPVGQAQPTDNISSLLDELETTLNELTNSLDQAQRVLVDTLLGAVGVSSFDDALLELGFSTALLARQLELDLNGYCANVLADVAEQTRIKQSLGDLIDQLDALEFDPVFDTTSDGASPFILSRSNFSLAREDVEAAQLAVCQFAPEANPDVFPPSGTRDSYLGFSIDNDSVSFELDLTTVFLDLSLPVLDDDRDENVNGTDPTLLNGDALTIVSVTAVESNRFDNNTRTFTSEAPGFTVGIGPGGDTVTYQRVPASPRFFGLDVFEYEVCDSTSAALGGPFCDTAEVTVSLNLFDNRPPTPFDDSYRTDEDTPLTVLAATGVLFNDTDPNLDTLTVLDVEEDSSFGPRAAPSGANPNFCCSTSTAQGGMVRMNKDGDFVYTPAPNFFGQDEFWYEVQDVAGATSTARVVLIVDPVNDQPVLDVDVYTVQENVFDGPPVTTASAELDIETPLAGLLINDNDPVEGDAVEVARVAPQGGGFVSVGAPITTSYGEVTVDADGTFIYQSDDNIFGTDTNPLDLVDFFEYEACDTGTPVACATSTVQITIQPMARADVTMEIVSITPDTKFLNANNEETTLDSSLVASAIASNLDSAKVVAGTHFTVELNIDSTGSGTPENLILEYIVPFFNDVEIVGFSPTSMNCNNLGDKILDCQLGSDTTNNPSFEIFVPSDYVFNTSSSVTGPLTLNGFWVWMDTQNVFDPDTERRPSGMTGFNPTNSVRLTATEQTNVLVSDVTATPRGTIGEDLSLNPDGDIAYAGESIEWTVEVTNLGPSEARNLVLSDDKTDRGSTRLTRRACSFICEVSSFELGTTPFIVDVDIGADFFNGSAVSSTNCAEFISRNVCDLTITFDVATDTFEPASPVDQTLNSFDDTIRLISFAEVKMTDISFDLLPFGGDVNIFSTARDDSLWAPGEFKIMNVTLINLGPSDALNVNASIDSDSTNRFRTGFSGIIPDNIALQFDSSQTQRVLQVDQSHVYSGELELADNGNNIGDLFDIVITPKSSTVNPNDWDPPERTQVTYQDLRGTQIEIVRAAKLSLDFIKVVPTIPFSFPPDPNGNNALLAFSAEIFNDGPNAIRDLKLWFSYTGEENDGSQTGIMTLLPSSGGGFSGCSEEASSSLSTSITHSSSSVSTFTSLNEKTLVCSGGSLAAGGTATILVQVNIDEDTDGNNFPEDFVNGFNTYWMLFSEGSYNAITGVKGPLRFGELEVLSCNALLNCSVAAAVSPPPDLDNEGDKSLSESESNAPAGEENNEANGEAPEESTEDGAEADASSEEDAPEDESIEDPDEPDTGKLEYLSLAPISFERLLQATLPAQRAALRHTLNVGTISAASAITRAARVPTVPVAQPQNAQDDKTFTPDDAGDTATVHTPDPLVPASVCSIANSNLDAGQDDLDTALGQVLDTLDDQISQLANSGDGLLQQALDAIAQAGQDTDAVRGALGSFSVASNELNAMFSQLGEAERLMLDAQDTLINRAASEIDQLRDRLNTLSTSSLNQNQLDALGSDIAADIIELRELLQTALGNLEAAIDLVGQARTVLEDATAITGLSLVREGPFNNDPLLVGWGPAAAFGQDPLRPDAAALVDWLEPDNEDASLQARVAVRNVGLATVDYEVSLTGLSGTDADGNPVEFNLPPFQGTNLAPGEEAVAIFELDAGISRFDGTFRAEVRQGPSAELEDEAQKEISRFDNPYRHNAQPIIELSQSRGQTERAFAFVPVNNIANTAHNWFILSDEDNVTLTGQAQYPDRSVLEGEISAGTQQFFIYCRKSINYRWTVVQYQALEPKSTGEEEVEARQSAGKALERTFPGGLYNVQLTAIFDQEVTLADASFSDFLDAGASQEEYVVVPKPNLTVDRISTAPQGRGVDGWQEDELLPTNFPLGQDVTFDISPQLVNQDILELRDVAAARALIEVPSAEVTLLVDLATVGTQTVTNIPLVAVVADGGGNPVTAESGQGSPTTFAYTGPIGERFIDARIDVDNQIVETIEKDNLGFLNCESYWALERANLGFGSSFLAFGPAHTVLSSTDDRVIVNFKEQPDEGFEISVFAFVLFQPKAGAALDQVCPFGLVNTWDFGDGSDVINLQASEDTITNNRVARINLSTRHTYEEGEFSPTLISQMGGDEESRVVFEARGNALSVTNRPIVIGFIPQAEGVMLTDIPLLPSYDNELKPDIEWLGHEPHSVTYTPNFGSRMGQTITLNPNNPSFTFEMTELEVTSEAQRNLVSIELVGLSPDENDPDTGQPLEVIDFDTSLGSPESHEFLAATIEEGLFGSASTDAVAQAPGAPDAETDEGLVAVAIEGTDGLQALIDPNDPSQPVLVKVPGVKRAFPMEDAIDYFAQQVQAQYNEQVATAFADADESVYLDPFAFQQRLDQAIQNTQLRIKSVVPAEPIRPSDNPEQNRTLSVVGLGDGDGRVRGQLIDCDVAGGEAAGHCTQILPLGATVTLMALERPDATFTGWSGCDRAHSRECILTVDDHRIVKASFAQDVTTVTLTLEADPDATGAGRVQSESVLASDGSVVAVNCRIEPTGVTPINPIPNVEGVTGKCELTLTPGSVIQLRAFPDAGSVIDANTWTGCVADAIPTICEVTLDDDKTVQVGFTLLQQTLTINLLGQGRVTSDGAINCAFDDESVCRETLVRGASVTLKAETASEDQTFASWSVNCNGTDPEISLILDSDKTCTANFVAREPTARTLTVSLDGDGDGEVEISGQPSTICSQQSDSDCFQEREADSEVMLMAVAAQGSEFAEWSGDCTGPDTQVTVKLAENRACTASFNLKTFTLTVEIDPSFGTDNQVRLADGGVCSEASCTYTGEFNSRFFLEARPDENSTFTSWSAGDCLAFDDKFCVVLMAEDKTVTAFFSDEGQLFLEVAPGGRVRVEAADGSEVQVFDLTEEEKPDQTCLDEDAQPCRVTFKLGATLILTATAREGFSVIDPNFTGDRIGVDETIFGTFTVNSDARSTCSSEETTDNESVSTCTLLLVSEANVDVIAFFFAPEGIGTVVLVTEEEFALRQRVAALERLIIQLEEAYRQNLIAAIQEAEPGRFTDQQLEQTDVEVLELIFREASHLLDQDKVSALNAMGDEYLNTILERNNARRNLIAFEIASVQNSIERLNVQEALFTPELFMQKRARLEQKIADLEAEEVRLRQENLDLEQRLSQNQNAQQQQDIQAGLEDAQEDGDRADSDDSELSQQDSLLLNAIDDAQDQLGQNQQQLQALDQERDELELSIDESLFEIEQDLEETTAALGEATEDLRQSLDQLQGVVDDASSVASDDLFGPSVTAGEREDFIEDVRDAIEDAHQVEGEVQAFGDQVGDFDEAMDAHAQAGLELDIFGEVPQDGDADDDQRAVLEANVEQTLGEAVAAAEAAGDQLEGVRSVSEGAAAGLNAALEQSGQILANPSDNPVRSALETAGNDAEGVINVATSRGATTAGNVDELRLKFNRLQLNQETTRTTTQQTVQLEQQIEQDQLLLEQQEGERENNDLIRDDAEQSEFELMLAALDLTLEEAVNQREQAATDLEAARQEIDALAVLIQDLAAQLNAEEDAVRRIVLLQDFEQAREDLEAAQQREADTLAARDEAQAGVEDLLNQRGQLLEEERARVQAELDALNDAEVDDVIGQPDPEQDDDRDLDIASAEAELERLNAQIAENNLLKEGAQAFKEAAEAQDAVRNAQSDEERASAQADLEQSSADLEAIRNQQQAGDAADSGDSNPVGRRGYQGGLDISAEYMSNQRTWVIVGNLNGGPEPRSGRMPKGLGQPGKSKLMGGKKQSLANFGVAGNFFFDWSTAAGFGSIGGGLIFNWLIPLSARPEAFIEFSGEVNYGHVLGAVFQKDRTNLTPNKPFLEFVISATGSIEFPAETLTGLPIPLAVTFTLVVRYSVQMEFDDDNSDFVTSARQAVDTELDVFLSTSSPLKVGVFGAVGGTFTFVPDATFTCIRLSVGGRIVVDFEIFDVTVETRFTESWGTCSPTRAFRDEAVGTPSLNIDRSYAGPGYASFVNRNLGVNAFGVQDVRLVENAFPGSDPQLITNGKQFLLLWVQDDVHKPLLQARELWYSTAGPDLRFSAPQRLTDDLVSDGAPTLGVDRQGRMVAAWARNRDPELLSRLDPYAIERELQAGRGERFFTTDASGPLEREQTQTSDEFSFTEGLKTQEIAFAAFDPVSNAWSEPAYLTDNQMQDLTPQLVGDENGELMLIWAQSPGSLPYPLVIPPEPSNLWSAHWDAEVQAFAEPELLLEGDQATERSFAYRDGRLLYVWIEDEVALATIFENGRRGLIAELAFGQNQAPAAAFSPEGVPLVLWMNKAPTTETTRLGSLDATLMEARLVDNVWRTDPLSLEGTNINEFRLIQDAGGNLALLWSQFSETQDQGIDAYALIYDRDMGGWTDKKQLTDDIDFETQMTPVLLGEDVIIAYVKQEITLADEVVSYSGPDAEDPSITYQNEEFLIPDVVQLGASHLHVMRAGLSSDLRVDAGSLRLNPAVPAPGEAVQIDFEVVNSGRMGVETEGFAVELRAQPDGPAIARVELEPLMVDQSAPVSFSWTVPNSSARQVVYAVLDPDQQVKETMTDNNVVPIPIHTYDLAFESFGYEYDQSGYSADDMEQMEATESDEAMAEMLTTQRRTVLVQTTVANPGVLSTPAGVIDFAYAVQGLTLNNDDMMTKTPAGSLEVPALAPGERVRLTFTWDITELPPDDYRLFGTLRLAGEFTDPLEALEVNLSNNEMDLLVKNQAELSLRAGVDVVDGERLLRVTVFNKGTLAADDVVVEVRELDAQGRLGEVLLHFDELDFFELSNLEAFEGAFVFRVPLPETDAPELLIVVDPASNIAETDEGNNSAMLILNQ